MRSPLLLCSLALLPLLSAAGEAESYCALATALGRVQAATLSAPEAFASLGDPATDKRSVVVGVRKSFSRDRQGRLATELAEAQCAAYRSQQRLGLRLASVEVVTEQRGLVALTAALETALAAADAHLRQERLLLARSQATLLDVRSAFEARDRLQEKRARAAQRLNYLAAHAPIEEAPLLPDAERAITDQARVTELGALLQAESGWDVSVAVGMRRGLSDGGQSAFASVALSRSFGEGASRSAAQETGALAARWLADQQEGPLYKLQRTRDAVAGAHAAGEMVRTGLLERRRVLRETLDTLQGSDTAAAARLARNLRTEILATDAELADTEARQSYLQSWLGLNGGQP
ncbi:hypothetical protein [Acidovorax sp. sic0104]|uniref:hypothetical protein n=1 Tax=Acidovorax sp. sic0104 TaxID=2854784 RepID=UPI001C43D63F|nr:hypothetical protein [Acidovorax sp. sic0104]MBV7542977.1 hypothetical protein [Acidovorax sp. sic0104]